MTADLQAIAIEQRWCQPCPSGNRATAGPVPWLGGPGRGARQAGVKCAAGPASAGIFIGRVLWGTSSRAQCLTCGVLARRSATDTNEIKSSGVSRDGTTALERR